MRRADFDRLPGFRVDPTVKNTAAGEYQGVRAIVDEDGQFEVTIKGRCGYGLPLHRGSIRRHQPDALIWINVSRVARLSHFVHSKV